jgi:hypothetical protein
MANNDGLDVSDFVFPGDTDEFVAELEAIRRMIREDFGLDGRDDERDDIFVGSDHLSDDGSDDGSDDDSDDGSGMLESEAQRLARDREHLRLLHPHLPLQRMDFDDAPGAAAGAAADTAAREQRPLPPWDESRDYSDRFKCCGCLESKALDDFVVADCGHAVLCRECWAQNQQTQRRDVCPWCRHSVRRWCRTRLWLTTNKMMVLDNTHDTITTRAAFNCIHCINPYLSHN